MKAVVQSRYGDPQEVLEVREIDEPVPAAGEVLVRVAATSVHADVWHVVTGTPYVLRLMGSGLGGPSNPVPGTDLAGVVEAVGEGVTRFEVGDEVFGESSLGMQWKNGGSFAELAVVPEGALAIKPVNVGFEEAACVPTAGYIVMVNLLGSATVSPGDEVLINGAGGGVGAMAVQIARARGARVTAVDSAEKRDLLLKLGANRVMDYRTEDCTTGESRYDLIFDVASTLSLKACRRVLKPDGVWVVIGHDHYGSVGRRVLGSLPQMFGLMARSAYDRNLPRPVFSPPPKQEIMEELAALLESDRITPIVGRCFSLDQVGEAMRCLQDGSVLGKILLTPSAR